MNPNYLTTLIGLLLVLIVGSLIYLLIPKEKTQSENQAFCATVVPVQTESVLKGKEIFKWNCAACHDKTMKNNLTGPALENSFRNWNRDTTLLLSYLNNNTSSEQIARMKKLRADLKFSGVMHNYQLNNNELKAIIAYMGR